MEVTWGLGLLALLVPLWVPGASGQEGPSTADVRTLSLEEALTLAVRGNRDLERARLNLEVAEEQVSEAWGAVYPSVDLTTSYNRNVSPAVSFLPAVIFDPDASPDDLIPVQFGADNVWSGNISVEQPLFRAGLFIGVGAAAEYRAFQEEGVRTALHDMVTRVRVLYYDLLLAQEQARLLERSVGRVVQSLEETRALNRAGLASDYDVLRLEVEFATLEPQLRRAEYELARMERGLVTELDLAPGTLLQLEGSLAEIDLDDPSANTPANQRILGYVGVAVPPAVTEETLDDLYRRAQLGNAGIQQAGLNVELRNAEMRLAQAEYLPEIALFGSYDVQAQQNGSPRFFGESGQRGYGRNVGVRVTLPIFSGFQRDARVDQRRAALRSAEIERGLAEDRLRDEVHSVLEDTDEARLRARSQRLAVEQARRGYEIASAQYREGLGSQLELTDAEVALRQSEFNYAQAVFDYLSARARLDFAVGEVPLPEGAP
jgi:outer membrane protein TolC